MVIRSFLAFEIPEEIKKTVSFIYEGLKASSLEGVRWVKQENIHLTVVFMGNINEKDIDAIGRAVEKTCNKYAPFRIKAKGAGVFSSLRNARVLWIGVEGDIERMTYFRESLQKKLKAFGIKREDNKRFSPHLTVGRFKKGFNQPDKLREVIERFKDVLSPEAVLNELALFKSELRPDGAVYTKLNSWPLRGKK